MIKLIDILNRLNSTEHNIGEYNSILLYESEFFNELANPEWAYEYKKTGNDVWEFNDRYGNKLGVRYLVGPKYFESYFIVKDLNGNEVISYDIESNKDKIDLTSISGGNDEHRSDTICKILLDEILPKYLVNQPYSLIKLHPLNEYRYKIFMKCAEICKEKYPNLIIKPFGKEIYLINP
jgi:hypothetical protein